MSCQRPNICVLSLFQRKFANNVCSLFLSLLLQRQYNNRHNENECMLFIVHVETNRKLSSRAKVTRVCHLQFMKYRGINFDQIFSCTIIYLECKSKGRSLKVEIFRIHTRSTQRTIHKSGGIQKKFYFSQTGTSMSPAELHKRQRFRVTRIGLAGQVM